MSIPSATTSIAKKAELKIFDYDDPTFAITYAKNGVATDLTDFRFDFYLKHGNSVLKTYSIASGSLTSTYLNKIGASVNILDIAPMCVDIRDTIQVDIATERTYHLVQVVTNDDDIKKAHVEYTIYARSH